MTGDKRRGRPPKPFDRANVILSWRDVKDERLRQLVVDAGLSDREADVWLTYLLTHLDRQLAPGPLNLSAIAVLLGCSPAYVSQLFRSARAKVYAVTGSRLSAPAARDFGAALDEGDDEFDFEAADTDEFDERLRG